MIHMSERKQTLRSYEGRLVLGYAYKKRFVGCVNLVRKLLNKMQDLESHLVAEVHTLF